MADTLAELLMRPVMPEEFDRRNGEMIDPTIFDPRPHARAFGAGLVDPMGLPSWAYNKLAGSPSSDWYMRRMQEARDESPVAAGMGSSVLPGLVAGPLGGFTMVETVGNVPLVMGLGANAGQLRSVLSPPRRPRPQAAYPPSGAY